MIIREGFSIYLDNRLYEAGQELPEKYHESCAHMLEEGTTVKKPLSKEKPDDSK